MSRYIEKEKAIENVSQIRLEVVEARAVGKTIFTEALRIYRDAVLKSLNEAPTADVVEVVRCKDCKHHPNNGGECDRSITHTSRDYVCEVNTYRYIGLDYCSYGERREE